MKQGFSRHVTQVRAAQRLQQMPGELRTTHALNVEIVKSLRVLAAAIRLMMFPVQRPEAPDVDAGQGSQQHSAPIVDSPTAEQRSMHAVVHHDRNLVEKQAD